MTVPVPWCGAGTPSVGSEWPSSTWFGVGVPCKVLGSPFFGPADATLIQREFSECAANWSTVSLCPDAGFPGRGCWAQRLVREDRTDFAWSGDRQGPYFPGSGEGLTV